MPLVRCVLAHPIPHTQATPLQRTLETNGRSESHLCWQSSTSLPSCSASRLSPLSFTCSSLSSSSRRCFLFPSQFYDTTRDGRRMDHARRTETTTRISAPILHPDNCFCQRLMDGRPFWTKKQTNARGRPRRRRKIISIAPCTHTHTPTRKHARRVPRDLVMKQSVNQTIRPTDSGTAVHDRRCGRSICTLWELPPCVSPWHTGSANLKTLKSTPVGWLPISFASTNHGVCAAHTLPKERKRDDEKKDKPSSPPHATCDTWKSAERHDKTQHGLDTNKHTYTHTSTVAFASFLSKAAASPLTCALSLSRTQTPSALAARLHLAVSVASREGTCSVTE